MRNVQSKTIGLSSVLAFVLSIGFMSPGLVLAAQEQKDLCHSEGNGTYHLITIPEPAWQTHYDHGDGGEGDEVDGMPGYVFDADCTPVEATVEPCPCDFSLSSYQSLSIPASLECYEDDSEGAGFWVGTDRRTEGFFWLIPNNFRCTIYDDPGFSIPGYPINGLTEGQIEGCRQDLVALIDLLALSLCD